ncbi:MAG: hypothetical protein WC267_00225 [Bacilli bacterium]
MAKKKRVNNMGVTISKKGSDYEVVIKTTNEETNNDLFDANPIVNTRTRMFSNEKELLELVTGTIKNYRVDSWDFDFDTNELHVCLLGGNKIVANCLQNEVKGIADKQKQQSKKVRNVVLGTAVGAVVLTFVLVKGCGPADQKEAVFEDPQSQEEQTDSNLPEKEEIEIIYHNDEEKTVVETVQAINNYYSHSNPSFNLDSEAVLDFVKMAKEKHGFNNNQMIRFLQIVNNIEVENFNFDSDFLIIAHEIASVNKSQVASHIDTSAPGNEDRCLITEERVIVNFSSIVGNAEVKEWVIVADKRRNDLYEGAYKNQGLSYAEIKLNLAVISDKYREQLLAKYLGGNPYEKPGIKGDHPSAIGVFGLVLSEFQDLASYSVLHSLDPDWQEERELVATEKHDTCLINWAILEEHHIKFFQAAHLDYLRTEYGSAKSRGYSSVNGFNNSNPFFGSSYAKGPVKVRRFA